MSLISLDYPRYQLQNPPVQNVPILDYGNQASASQHLAQHRVTLLKYTKTTFPHKEMLSSNARLGKNPSNAPPAYETPPAAVINVTHATCHLSLA